MAQPSLQQFKTLTQAAAGLPPETLMERVLTALTVLASGQNPDGSAFTLSTSGGGGGGGGAVTAADGALVTEGAIADTAVSTDAAGTINAHIRGLVKLLARSTVGTPTSIANANTNTALLASNAARKGATIFNDDTVGAGASLNVALGFAASATAFNVVLVPQAYYEVPFGFTGAINGFASAATGNARIVEFT